MADNPKSTNKNSTRKNNLLPLSAATKAGAAASSGSRPKPLSPKEKSVLEFLEVYIRSNGVSPTYQEICQHFGFASYNSVQRYLKQLESKGYIQIPWSNQKRAITLLHPASALLDFLPNSRSPHSQDEDPSHTTESVSNVLPAVMPSESVNLPLLGRVAAGSPIEALDYDEFIDVPASLVRYADRTYALRVQGQSMIDDGILDGDVILVQRQSTASNGEIVVAVVNEEATVKRFYMHRGDSPRGDSKKDSAQSLSGRMVELRPANSSMSPMWFDPGDVQIRGIVVGLIRKFS